MRDWSCSAPSSWFTSTFSLFGIPTFRKSLCLLSLLFHEGPGHSVIPSPSFITPVFGIPGQEGKSY